MVKNDLGQDCIGRNPTDRRRSGSKISVIVDMNRVPLAMTFYGANRNDIKTIEDTLDAIPFTLKKDRRRSVNIVGDKGYAGYEEGYGPVQLKLISFTFDEKILTNPHNCNPCLQK